MVAASSHLCRCAATWRASFEPPRYAAYSTAAKLLLNRRIAPIACAMTAQSIDPHSIAASSGMVRVETLRIKPEQGPGPAHVLRQRRGDIDRAATSHGMRNDKAACMQVQLGLDAAVGQDLVALVFVVAADGGADQPQMRTTLVRPRGAGL